MRSKRKARWRLMAAGAVVSSVVALTLAAGPAGAAMADGAAGSASAANGAVQPLSASAPTAGGPSKTVTLVTGDVVRVTGKPGHQSAQVVQNAGSAGSLSAVEFRRQQDLYVIPGAAVPLVMAGKLDEGLFDVSELVRDGYTGSTLPVLVTYASGTLAAQAVNTHQLAGTTSGGQYLWSIRGLATGVNLKQGRSFFNSVTVPAAPPGGKSPQAPAGASLALRPGVAKVWLDAKVHATSVDVSRTAIGADTAWAAGYQGATATVAILDTGIDSSHPDFAGQIAASQNFVPAGSPGGGDPTDVTDRFGHGTHVAGIIAGTGAASGGLYSGVAPRAKLVIGKVLSDDGSGDDSWIIAGMQWAADQAKIISMSLGGDVTDGTDPLSQALNVISGSTGALFVVAAGNEGISPDGNPNGGPGSCAQCIQAPGAATAALTVGAITDGCDFDSTDPNACPRNYSGNDIPYFSSTGPRLGDFAIKPEITAPGVDIPSALASGTGIGVPVAAYPNLYTYLSGTSMATPMVSGSAAILLGEHPAWTAQQLRDALTSTATPNAGEPEYWQGSGMVNVGKAATQAIFGTGDLNLGTAAYPQQPGSSTLTGTITYTNTGSAPQTLTLSSSFATAPDNFGFQFQPAPWSPPAAAVSLPGQVTVPAGGSQAVQLSIDASQAPYFSTYGLVTATAADGSIVRTAVGFTRAALTHRLTLTAIDRTGAKETTNGYSYGYLMDLTNGQLYGVTFTNGEGTILGTRDNQLIADRTYAFLGQIASFGPAPYYHLQSWTQLAEPQIMMHADQSFTFDARNAGLVRARTQRPAVTTLECSSISRTVQLFYLALQLCGTGNAVGEGADIYALGGGQATTGSFQHVFSAYSEQAPIAVTAHGLAASILPQYSMVIQPTGTLDSDPAQPRFPASASLQVADVGAGTPAEIAAAHVAGKIALLHPADNGNVINNLPYNVGLQLGAATASAIASAGAAGILVAPPADGITYVWYNPADVPSIPTALLSYQDAAQLTSLLTAGRASVTVTSAWPSHYTYALTFTQPGQGLTNGATFSARDSALAQVTTRYHNTAPGQYYSVFTVLPPGSLVGASLSSNFQDDIPARTIRTEMFTPGGSFREFRNPEIPDWQPLSELASSPLAAGHYEMNVGSGPWVPEASVTTGGSYLMDPTVELDSSAGFLQDANPTGTVTVVCQPPACQQTPSGDKLSGDGLYQVVVDAAQPAPPDGTALSVTTHTEWTIHVHLNADPGVQVTQPAIQTTWYVDGGLDNVVPTGTPYAVRVVPSYPAGIASQGPVAARLWATYDDGTTWVPVPGIQVVRPGQPATFTLKTPARTNGYVGYRVQMSDASGNAINQTVIRAAYTQSPT